MAKYKIGDRLICVNKKGGAGYIDLKEFVVKEITNQHSTRPIYWAKDQELFHNGGVYEDEVVLVSSINKKEDIMAELTAMQKRNLDGDIQVLVEEGYLNSELSLTPKAKEDIMARLFMDKKQEIVKDLRAARKQCKSEAK